MSEYGPGANPNKGPVSGVVGFTPTERVLAFIRRYIGEKGYPPSVRDIMRGCGFKGTSAVSRHLERLADQGIIRVDPHVARGIALVKEKP